MKNYKKLYQEQLEDVYGLKQMLKDSNNCSEDLMKKWKEEVKKSNFYRVEISRLRAMLEEDGVDKLHTKTGNSNDSDSHVIHAHWELGSPYSKCSNCGFSFPDVWDVDNYDNYCRHCGAKMDGKDILEGQK